MGKKQTYPVAEPSPDFKTVLQWLQEGQTPKKGEEGLLCWTNRNYKVKALYYKREQVEENSVAFQNYKTEKAQRAKLRRLERALKENLLEIENKENEIEHDKKALDSIRTYGEKSYYEGTAEEWEKYLETDTKELEEARAKLPGLRNKVETEKARLQKLIFMGKALEKDSQ